MSWQHAIVVGASSGIGAAVARRLAGDGVRVALVARREAELERVAHEIAEATGDPSRILRALTRPLAVFTRTMPPL